MTDALPLPNPAALAELEASAAPAARLLRLFANEQRLMLMCRLSEGECAVGELAVHENFVRRFADGNHFQDELLCRPFVIQSGARFRRSGGG